MDGAELILVCVLIPKSIKLMSSTYWPDQYNGAGTHGVFIDEMLPNVKDYAQFVAFQVQ